MDIREAIVGGSLAPNVRLVEAELTETFRMSRGDVRNALIRLEQEGLVVREPHRGARVREVSNDEAVEILEARAVLEGLAVRMTATRIDGGGIERLRDCLDRQHRLLEAGDLLGSSEVNAELHSLLLQLSGHQTAIRLIGALNSHSVRYQYRTILIPGRPANSLAEHTAIVEAVSAHDADGAEHALRHHLFNVAEGVRNGRLPAGIDNSRISRERRNA